MYIVSVFIDVDLCWFCSGLWWFMLIWWWFLLILCWF